LSEFAAAHVRAVALAEHIRADDEAFHRHANWLIRFGFETADIAAALNDINRASSSGLSLPIDPDLDRLLRSFVSEHASLLEETRRLVLTAASGDVPVSNADFHLNGWLRLLFPSDNASRVWLTVTSEAVRLAQGKGLRTALIPDYLVPLMRGSVPGRVLSFHTEGVAPGLTHFKPADLPDYIWIDSRGYAGWASLAQKELSSLDLPPLSDADKFFARHRQEVLAGNVSKYAQPEASSEIDLPEQYVFVAMQIATDRTQQLARIPMLKMLDIVIARFRDSPIKVVVKQHPKCKSEMVAHRLASLADSGDIILRGESIHRLIDGSLAVVTINSGVGSEAILHLKPIYLFGEADYGCVTHRILSAEHFNEATSPICLPVPAETMKQFLCYYRQSYLVDITDRDRLRSEIGRRVLQLEEAVGPGAGVARPRPLGLEA
jgi:hypothetical protein